MPAQGRVCHGAHPEHTSSSDAGDLRCCVHQCSKPYSEFFTFVTDIFWGFTQENIATHHRPIPLTHQGTSGCAARCRLLRPGIASPRAPCAWSFQGQPVLTPVFSRACFPQTGGAEQIPSNLSHRQHSRWQAQCWRQGPKSTRRVCTRRYLRSPGISPNNTHRLLQLPAQGINHFPVGYHFLSCVSCAFLIG